MRKTGAWGFEKVCICATADEPRQFLQQVGFEATKKICADAKPAYISVNTTVTSHFRMTLSFKHIGLLVGIASIFLSFLFAGRQQGTYQILLLGGLATAFVFYLTILFGREKLKSKLFWSAFVVACAVLQWLTEPILVDTSYRYYISRNQSTLNELNDILQRKHGEVFMLNDSVTAKSDTITFDEKEKLKRDRKDLGVYMISKSDKGIYYGLWGFLDVRLGITYLPTPETNSDKFRHLTGNWFH